MNKNILSIGLYIIASAIIWGAVIIGCAYKLKGTDCFDEIVYILSIGSTVHLVLIWGPVAVMIKKLKEGE